MPKKPSTKTETEQAVVPATTVEKKAKAAKAPKTPKVEVAPVTDAPVVDAKR